MTVAGSGSIATVYQFQNLSGMIQTLCGVVVLVSLIVISLILIF